MAIYSVAYDLQRPGQNYPDLLRYLRSLESHHAQRSLWFVSTNMTVFQLRDACQRYIDTTDLLFVSQMFKGYWASAYMTTAAAWLQARGL